MFRIAILNKNTSREKKALELSRNLQIPVTDSAADYDFLLVFTGDRLELRDTADKAPGPLYVDFSSRALDWRRRFGGGRKEPLARAVGLKHNRRPVVLDNTAGLGRDSFILAGLGCTVYLRERSPVIAALLQDGLARGLQNEAVRPVIEKMRLVDDEAGTVPAKVEVIYLDPMYPGDTLKAQVKKDMQFLRKVAGEDGDTGELLSRSLSAAGSRVVVKRPQKASPVPGPPPSFAIKAGKHRFDVYLVNRSSQESVLD